MKTYTIEWSCCNIVHPERSVKNSGKPSWVMCGGLSQVEAESPEDATIAMRTKLGKKANVNGFGASINILND
jgi:hypothetical protein